MKKRFFQNMSHAVRKNRMLLALTVVEMMLLSGGTQRIAADETVYLR